MLENDSVIALVVTYNRKVLLAECLEAILHQTAPVDEVLVIDNASTDGTKGYLKEKGFLADPHLTYVKMPENTGGSGGFYEGIRRARESAHGWIWLMDDDAIPEPDCLEKLLQAKALLERNSEKFSFLASCIFGAEGEYMNVPRIDERLSSNGYASWYQHLGDGLLKISGATFVSLLISMDAVRSCGLPCKEYFIWWDDLEYTLRLTSHYADAYMVGSSVAIHRRENARALRIEYVTDKSRIQMYHYYYRNRGITYRYYRTKRFITLMLLTDNFLLLLRVLRQKYGLRKAGAILRGTAESFTQYRKFRTYIDRELAGSDPVQP